jgi:cobalamin biosynthetic protein CobC
MLEHGGNLNDAIRHFGRPREAWLDLSTGINPHGWPVPMLTADAWHRLPESNTQLLAAARACYGASHLLPVAGTQAAIQALPRLRAHSRVVTATPAYAEHAHRWRLAGHAVREVPYAQLSSMVDDCDVMVVCNPNNPTGETVAPDVLRQWAARLAARDGWLIVDEAFGDVTPELSVAAAASQAGLIVLRSVGKFYGLAGLRLGFVIADESLLQNLHEAIGPWTVSGPAQQIGAAALSDVAWQTAMRTRLLVEGDRLQKLLSLHAIASTGCALYQYWPEKHAAEFAECMAQHGIWIRRFMNNVHGVHGIRLGLPADENGWQRLQSALASWKSQDTQQGTI